MNKRASTLLMALAVCWSVPATAATFFSEAIIDWNRLELGCVDTNPADGVPCSVDIHFDSFETFASAGSSSDNDIAGGSGANLYSQAVSGSVFAESAAGDVPGITRSYVSVTPNASLNTPYAEATTRGVVTVSGGYATIKLPIFLSDNASWPPASDTTRILFNEDGTSIDSGEYFYTTGAIERILSPSDGTFGFVAEASSYLYVAAVPEPETYAMLGMGSLMTVYLARRRKRG